MRERRREEGREEGEGLWGGEVINARCFACRRNCETWTFVFVIRAPPYCMHAGPHRPARYTHLSGSCFPASLTPSCSKCLWLGLDIFGPDAGPAVTILVTRAWCLHGPGTLRPLLVLTHSITTSTTLSRRPQIPAGGPPWTPAWSPWACICEHAHTPPPTPSGSGLRLAGKVLWLSPRDSFPHGYRVSSRLSTAPVPNTDTLSGACRSRSVEWKAPGQIIQTEVNSGLGRKGGQSP